MNTPESAFFNDNYDLLSLGQYGSGKKKYIGPKDLLKRCRFCGKDKDNTTFGNQSHVLPEFLGNHQLILVDECDQCNEFFSVIGFGNWMYQIHVPSHLDGRSFAYSWFYYPIPHSESLEFGQLQSKRVDLSDSEKGASLEKMALFFRQDEECSVK